MNTPHAQWVLPTTDEWYKAAYYKGGSLDAGYWEYATQSDTIPTASATNGTNSANYNNAVQHLTDVGFYSNSPGPYGTFDQGGDVFQLIEDGPRSTLYNCYARGGSFTDDGPRLQANLYSTLTKTYERFDYGFRLAELSPTAVPLPSVAWMSITLLVPLWITNWRRQRRSVVF